MADLEHAALDRIYFEDFCTSSIMFVYATDDIRFVELITLNGTIRIDADDFIKFRETILTNIKIIIVYDRIEFSELLENHGTLRWTGSDTITLEEIIALGKELNLNIVDIIHLEEHGNRTYEATTDDNVTLSDTALKLHWEDVLDALGLSELAEAANRPDRTDNLAFSDVATFKLVRSRPIVDSLTITDYATGYLDNLTKEYQPQ